MSRVSRRPPTVTWRSLPLAMALALVVGAVAWAGHEITFYPSFYPQEITLRPLDAPAGARALETSAIQAYLGPDPFASRRAPEHVRWVESLGSLVVLTFDLARPSGREATTRCAAGTRVQQALAGASGPPRFVAHPYPVTPLHPDWLAHWDLARAERTSAADGRAVRVKAPSGYAEILAGAGIIVDGENPDATLEQIELASGPWNASPWPKAGWFQTVQLHAGDGSETDDTGLAEARARRESGRFTGEAERVDLERRIVSALVRGCRRVPLGYTVRREAYSAEYSNGIENVAWDSERGLASAIFLRTAKLKDFPWNGWLTLGVPDPGRAAWNPVAGFTDLTGRTVWDAVGDPALLPSPYGDAWLPNRVRPVDVTAGPVTIPGDALVVDRTTGRLRPAGVAAAAATPPATARITYRVFASKFHDGTAMSSADLLMPYVLAFRASRRDAEVARTTARLRAHLAAVRLVRTESDIKDLGEIHLVHAVHVVEVYLTGDADPAVLAAVAPPWSAVPWEVAALMDEATSRGLAAFSRSEAGRRGVPWLDLVRDARLASRLAGLTDALAGRVFVPEGLRDIVTAAEARARWTALRRFVRERGHHLVANGPYQVLKVPGDRIVLGVFRDHSYPLGVGTFDRWALPRRAFITGVAPGPTGLRLAVELEHIEKFERSYKIVRGPLGAGADGDGVTAVPPVARYVALHGDRRVAAAGASTRVEDGHLVVPLDNLPRGDYRVLLTVTVGENLVRPEVQEVTWTRS